MSVKEIEQQLGFTFNQKNLLIQALTHSSYAKQKNKNNTVHNERLEFLGDAVLKLIMSDYLYTYYPHFEEGDLTKKRAVFISDKVLFEIGQHLHIGQHIKLSNSEKRTKGHEKPSNIANAMEALLGAIYLDSGFEKAKAFLIKEIQHLYPQLAKMTLCDYKTELQEKMQKLKKKLPEYQLKKEEGPEHEKEFFIEVTIETAEGNIACIGKGRSKKEAEQMAAKWALEALAQYE